jgi:hypothetical protein
MVVETPYTVQCRELFPHADLTGRTMPLLRRAWVLQELLLSPRIVHFSKCELLWGFMEQNSCDWGPDRSAYAWRTLLLKKHFVTRECKGRLQSSQNFQQELAWHELVQEPTQYDLTYSGDISPAIQGLAKRMHLECGCAYYAGIWETHLHADVLWRSMGREGICRSSTWRAPSWSWASVQGSVMWLSDASQHTTRLTATTIDICTTSIGSDAFGQLKSGYWGLRGSCVAASISYNRYRSEFTFHVRCRTGTKFLEGDLNYNILVPADGDMSRARVEYTSLETMDRISHVINRDPSYETFEHYLPDYERLLLILIAIQDLTWKFEHPNSKMQRHRFLVLKTVSTEPPVYERTGVAFSDHDDISPWESFCDTDLDLEDRDTTII